MKQFVGFALEQFGAVVLAGFAQFRDLPLHVVQALLQPGVFAVPLAPFAVFAPFALGEVFADFVGLAFQLFGAVVFAMCAQFLDFAFEVVQSSPEAFGGMLVFLVAMAFLPVLAGTVGQLSSQVLKFLPGLFPHLVHEFTRLVRSDVV